MCSSPNIKHQIPTRYGRFPESRFVPKLSAIGKMFVPSPNIIYQYIDLIIIFKYQIENSFYLLIIIMIALQGYTITPLLLICS